MSIEKKDEIMDLPEGKSSEEIDAMMMEGEEAEEKPEADDDLAQEALDATEEESPAEESVEDKEVEDETKDETKDEEKEEKLSEEQQQLRAKDSKIASMKHTAREQELENAKLQGQLEAQEKIHTEPEKVPKSPLQLAMEAEGVDTPDDLQTPYSVMIKQQKWEKEQDAKKATKDQTATRQQEMAREVTSLQAGELSSEQAGDGLDYKTVIGLGQGYLDQADMLKIDIISKRDGVAAATRKAYDLCKDAVLTANNSDSKLLQSALDAKNKVKDKPKGKTVTQKKLKTEKDIDDLTTEGESESEAESDSMGKRLFTFINE